ncbi:sigma-70 family RNA polymerase sigma factor [Streptomyces sp. NPDC050400]|uniref:sigma-70 family RNA polymerase sigma factor n=1 Tax=Streptomyces sp. NPDC050400 TaxID=3365610 RepID=UPI0037A84AA0
MAQNAMATSVTAVTRTGTSRSGLSGAGVPRSEAAGSELLRTIVGEHRAGLVSYAEKMLGDRGLAEDIAQETVIRAWRNIDRLLGMEGSVRGWLFTVARHLVIDRVRKAHVRREVVGEAHHERASGPDGTALVHDTLVVRPLLLRLSPEHRAVLVHIYLCDRSIQETAGILGVPTGTVKSRHHNALRKLRAVARREAA